MWHRSSVRRRARSQHRNLPLRVNAELNRLLWNQFCFSKQAGRTDGGKTSKKPSSRKRASAAGGAPVCCSGVEFLFPKRDDTLAQSDCSSCFLLSFSFSLSLFHFILFVNASNKIGGRRLGRVGIAAIVAQRYAK